MQDKGILRGKGWAPSFSFMNWTSARIPFFDSGFEKAMLLSIRTSHASRVLCHSSSPRLKKVSLLLLAGSSSSNRHCQSFACKSHTSTKEDRWCEKAGDIRYETTGHRAVLSSPTFQDDKGHSRELVEVPSLSVIAISSLDCVRCLSWDLFVRGREIPRKKAMVNDEIHNYVMCDVYNNVAGRNAFSSSLLFIVSSPRSFEISSDTTSGLRWRTSLK